MQINSGKNKDKQDEMITEVKNAFATNEIYEDGTDTYFCSENRSGEWYIMKIDGDSLFTHASILNNDTVTNYADARADVDTLTYGTYNQAFN